MAADPHLAAYAKGLEDAAQIAEEHGGWSLGPHVARCIRALSPLPPGTRVVAQVQIGETCPMCGHVAEPLPDEAIAALRALTGGDDRD